MKGGYAGLTNVQKCKLRREKLKAKSSKFLNKEKERLAKWRTNMKQDKEYYDKFKDNNKFRKWAAKKNKEKDVIVPVAVNAKVCAQEETSTHTPGSAYSCRQTPHQSISRADSHLSKSPHKKAEIIQRLATKCKHFTIKAQSACSKIVEDLVVVGNIKTRHNTSSYVTHVIILVHCYILLFLFL